MKALSNAIEQNKGVLSGIHEAMLYQDIENSYQKPENRPQRIGLHASSLIKAPSQFCIREQVLSLVYERDGNDSKTPTNLKRIFEMGDLIHEQWQKRFKEMGIATHIEAKAFSKKNNLYLTPDLIIDYHGKKYIVEIKSCSPYMYSKQFKNNHPLAEKQLQLYMHFLRIRNGIILVDNKGTQEYKLFFKQYDIKSVQRPLKRLRKVNLFYRYKRLPKIAYNPDITVCKGCSYKDACRGIKRQKLIK